MIYDVILAGHTGVVGKELLKCLQGMPLSVNTIDDFEDKDYCSVFINCSNISASPIKGAALLLRTYEKMFDKCDVFVQVQTIGTLLEFSNIKPNRFNMGASYFLLNKYLLGKIIQEKLIVLLGNESRCKIALAYLGNFDAHQSVWRDVKLRALAQGWVSPPLGEKSRNASADGDLLARFVARCCSAHPTFDRLTRYLIVKKSQPWCDTLGSDGTSRTTSFAELIRVRNLMRLAFYVYLNIISRIVPAWGWRALASNVKTDRPPRAKATVVQGPVDFSGFPDKYFFSRLKELDRWRFTPEE